MPRKFRDREYHARHVNKCTYIARDKNSDKSNSSDYQVLFSSSSK